MSSGYFHKMPLISVSLVISLVIILSSSNAQPVNESELKLELVTIVHRHGDRTPIAFTTNDPYSDDDYWPDGKSQLLAEGKERMYQFGMDIRRYYRYFLTDNPREVYARSSDADRCIESTQLLFHGLYKAEGRWRYNLKTDYLPIPIHTIPKENDKMLIEGSDCPRLNQEQRKVFDSPQAKRALQKYQKTLNLISTEMSTPIDNLGMILGLRDSLAIEKEQNFTLPSWLTPEVFTDLDQLVDDYSVIQNDSPEILRLRCSKFLQNVETQFRDKISARNTKYRQLRLLTYSTHDTMLGAFLSALKVFNSIRVPYGAALLIELYSAPSTPDHYIKLKYWNDTYKDEQHILEPPYCKNRQLCRLDEFFGHLDTIIYDNLEYECQTDATGSVESEEEEEETIAWTWVGVILVTMLSFVTLAIFILFITVVVKQFLGCSPKRSNEEYDRIL